MTEQATPSRLDEARDLCKPYIYGSMGFGLIPLPALDFAAITLTQMKMIHSLSKFYDIKFSEDIGKTIIGSLVGGVLPAPVGVGVASFTKVIPIVGPLLGATSVSMFAGASTYAVSRVFIQHFEAGGTFLDLDPEAVREYFQKEFEAGQDLAGNNAKKTSAKAG